MRTVAARLLPVAIADVTARVIERALNDRMRQRGAPWVRRNYAGRDVPLSAGPAVTAGTLAGLLLAPSGPAREATVSAVAIAAAVGLYDDLAGSADNRGLAGHLGALRRGEVTTGTVKVLGLAVAGMLAARRSATPHPLLTTALVAGGANLANLLDVRPGRALKVSLLVAAAASGGSGAPLGAAAGAAAALLPADLQEKTMLGDCGAGAVGAAVATGLAARLQDRALLAAVGVVSALAVLSEFVSFSKVIAAVRPLRALDELGRRPPPDAVP